MSKYVEDHDLRAGKYAETEGIITALYSMAADLNAFTNPKLFVTLLSYSPEVLFKLGQPAVLSRQKEIAKLLSSKRLFKIYLEKEKTLIQGFSCVNREQSLINDLGEALAEESLDKGFDNIGIVLKAQDGGYRVCIRGNNKKEKSPCLAVANAIGGGGHKYAAGGWISKETLKKWF